MFYRPEIRSILYATPFACDSIALHIDVDAAALINIGIAHNVCETEWMLHTNTMLMYAAESRRSHCLAMLPSAGRLLLLPLLHGR